jgi:serine phosphatase RsbU (regulator of sigma subunit)
MQEEQISEPAAHAQREEALLKLERDIQIGRRIQASFLPTTLPEVPHWELAAFFQPAREVAGDFYDAFMLNQNRRVGIVIGDVCDKGVGAALFMALFRSLTRAFAQQHYSLRWMDADETDFLTSPVTDRRRGIPSTGTTALKNAIGLTNNYIINNHGDTNMFATMFFGVLDPVAGVLTYINGGHNPPWLFNAAGVKMRLMPTGPAVGMLPDVDFGIQQVTFEPGDILLTFTDGVPEARDPDGAFFTEAKLRMLINDPMPAAAQELLERIHGRLTAHIGTAAQFDDITMLAVRRLSASDVPDVS